SKRRVEFPNGSRAIALSSEEPERARGLNLGLFWADELCAWTNAQETWDMLSFALRDGKNPRWIFSTTPKPIKLLRDLMAREGKDVVISRGTTFDNAANLAPGFIEAMRARIGSRLANQEFFPQLLDAVPGALVKLSDIEEARVSQAPSLQRIVVAVDPAVSNNEGSDETGIIVAGRAEEDGHCYVLADYSLKGSPQQWAQEVVRAYH